MQAEAIFPSNDKIGSVFGISDRFQPLSPSERQIIHALLTRAPLYSSRRTFTFDLHVLSTPPAFNLSQNQTLQLIETTSLFMISMNETQSSVSQLALHLSKNQGSQPFPRGVSLSGEAGIYPRRFGLSTIFFDFRKTFLTVPPAFPRGRNFPSAPSGTACQPFFSENKKNPAQPQALLRPAFRRFVSAAKTVYEPTSLSCQSLFSNLKDFCLPLFILTS